MKKGEVFRLANSSRGTYQPNEFARSLGILLFAREGRANSRLVWTLNAYDEFESRDLELCRELEVPKCRNEDALERLRGRKRSTAYN